MWNRKELKAKAKQAFKNNYWKSVLVAILLTMAVGNGAASAISSATSTGTQTIMDSNYSDDYYENEYYADEYYEDEYSSLDEVMKELEEILPPVAVKLFTTITLAIVMIIAVIICIVRIFILAPLEVGGCNYFKINANTDASLDTLSLPFKKRYYWKTVGTVFLRNLYITLWSCLLVIPGIIKSYEYRMIPYILSDAPGITRKEAFRISKEMMRGNKWKAFVLDFSFIGWQLASAATCGLVGLFYVNPYMYAANAELFIALREDYFKNRG
jgi:uncharacterized membrane protein